jgi:hypothetical protein
LFVVAKKRIAELDLTLMHLQQNVEIPEIILQPHPRIREVIEKVRSLPSHQFLSSSVKPQRKK